MGVHAPAPVVVYEQPSYRPDYERERGWRHAEWQRREWERREFERRAWERRHHGERPWQGYGR